MKIHPDYTLYINTLVFVAYYGTESLKDKMADAKNGTIAQCNLFQLKHNIKVLTGQGFLVLKYREK